MRLGLGPLRRSRMDAFTLPEVLVTTTLMLIVMFGVFVLYEMGQTTYLSGTQQWDTQSQARLAIEWLAREIRVAGYATPDKLSDHVVIATNDTISVHADIDGPLGDGPRYITYTLRDCDGHVGTTLYRNASAPDAPLAVATFCGGTPFIDNVTSLAFTYYEVSNVPIPYPLAASYELDHQAAVTGTGHPTAPAVGSERNRIRQVKIALTVQEQRGSTTAVYTATTDVMLRNLPVQ
jgi:Tfp pilus assembly protein PilW